MTLAFLFHIIYSQNMSSRCRASFTDEAGGFAAELNRVKPTGVSIQNELQFIYSKEID